MRYIHYIQYLMYTVLDRASVSQSAGGDLVVGLSR